MHVLCQHLYVLCHHDMVYVLCPHDMVYVLCPHDMVYVLCPHDMVYVLCPHDMVYVLCHHDMVYVLCHHVLTCHHIIKHECGQCLSLRGHLLCAPLQLHVVQSVLCDLFLGDY